MNVICRDEQQKEDVVLSSLRCVFPVIYQKSIPDHVNEILFVLKSNIDVNQIQNKRRTAAKMRDMVKDLDGLKLL